MLNGENPGRKKFILIIQINGEELKIKGGSGVERKATFEILYV